MLIIRIGLASDRTFLGVAATAVSTGTAQATWAAAGSALTSADRMAVRRRTDAAAYAMQDLKVEITQVIENDAEYTTADPKAQAGTRSVRSRERREVLRAVRPDLQVDVSVVDIESGTESPRSSVHDRSPEKRPVEDGLV